MDTIGRDDEPVGVAFVGSSALLGGMSSVLLGRLREKTSP